MISKVSLKNFKEVTAEYDLGRGTYIAGRNFVGKSAIDQAIRCLILGYVPGMAKTSSAMKMFASGYPMRIGATIGTYSLGIGFERVKSTIKQTEDNTGEGKADEQTRVLFDPSIFFGLSDAQRISKACELVQSQSGSPDDLEKSIGEAIKGNASLAPQFLRWKKEVKATSKTLNDLLANTEIFWKERRKELNAEKERMAKTAEGVSDLSALEAEISKLPDRHEVEAKKSQLTAQIQRLTEDISTAQANAKNADSLRAQKERYEAGAAALPVLNKTLAQAEAECTAADTAYREAFDAYTASQDAMRKFKETSALPPKKVEETEIRTDEFMTGAEEGKEYRAVATIRLDENGIAVCSVESWQEIIPAVSNPEDDEAREAEYMHRNDELTEELETVTAKMNRTHDALGAVNEKVQNLRDLVAASKACASELVVMNEQQINGLVAPEVISGWESERTEKSQQLGLADGSLQQIAAYEQDRKRVQEAAAQRERIDAAVKLIGKVLALVEQKKQEIVSLSIDAPLAIANKVGAGILKGPLVFEEGEIGMRVGDQFRSSRVFSGTEAKIVQLGLTAGLASRSKLRTLMLDEFGVIDSGYAIRLIQNLDSLVESKEIDQFIILGPTNTEIAAALGGPLSGLVASGALKVINL